MEDIFFIYQTINHMTKKCVLLQFKHESSEVTTKQ